jgi:hypothetical protein
MFGAGMAGGIGWQTVGGLFSLAKRRAARAVGAKVGGGGDGGP